MGSGGRWLIGRGWERIEREEEVVFIGIIKGWEGDFRDIVGIF